MESDSNKAYRRWKEQNELEVIHEWLASSFDDYVFFRSYQFADLANAEAYSANTQRVRELIYLVSKRTKDQHERWNRQDFPNQWPPDDLELPDGTGS